VALLRIGCGRLTWIGIRHAVVGSVPFQPDG
jgi:hypothetical protein